MRHFDDIVAAHLATDRLISVGAVEIGADPENEDALRRIAGVRSFNDQAYFVLLVAQLDDLATEAVAELVHSASRSADWRHREIWGRLIANNRKVRDIPFRTRLALLIDPQVRGVEYRSACRLYDARSKIAHGDLNAPVSIQTAIDQLRAIASLIQEVP